MKPNAPSHTSARDLNRIFPLPAQKPNKSGQKIGLPSAAQKFYSGVVWPPPNVCMPRHICNQFEKSTIYSVPGLNCLDLNGPGRARNRNNHFILLVDPLLTQVLSLMI